MRLRTGVAAAAVGLAALSGCSSAEQATRPPRPAPAAAPAKPPQRPFRVGFVQVRLVDRRRTIRLPDGRREPRTLVTDVRYPASAGGPYPLIVFGHGFRLAPATYTSLLRAWAQAGYVVAAPAFPLEKPDAPGGPDEADLVNQPADVSVVISRLLAGPLRELIDPRRIAVAGHSDGGETALAATYDRRFRDPRVRAAVILSGARIPGTGVLRFGRPLLAVQGTADTVNPPSSTYDFYRAAGRPKYLLKLLGAMHEPPYTNEQPQLGIVERVTIAFFDRYLGGRAVSTRRLKALGDVARISSLTAEP